MRTTAFLFLIFLKTTLLYAQEAVYEYIPPESSFKELKQRVSKNPLPEIEHAFIHWDYKSIKPYLIKEIRRSCRSFFKVNRDSLTRYTWKKRTHTGPMRDVIPGGNFGFSREFNSLRLESTDKRHKTFIVNYYYYIQDSALIIYAVQSERYPHINNLNAAPKLWVKMDSHIQALRKDTDQKNTMGMTQQLSRLESLKPSLTKQPNFKEPGYLTNLSISYGNLSWYLILEGKFEEAIAAAQKGIAYDETQIWIYTNYALGNLLAGHKDTALTIYDRYKNQYIANGKFFKASFKEDLLEVKQMNLISPALYDEIILFLNK